MLSLHFRRFGIQRACAGGEATLVMLDCLPRCVAEVFSAGHMCHMQASVVHSITVAALRQDPALMAESSRHGCRPSGPSCSAVAAPEIGAEGAHFRRARANHSIDPGARAWSSGPVNLVRRVFA